MLGMKEIVVVIVDRGLPDRSKWIDATIVPMVDVIAAALVTEG